MELSREIYRVKCYLKVLKVGWTERRYPRSKSLLLTLHSTQCEGSIKSMFTDLSDKRRVSVFFLKLQFSIKCAQLIMWTKYFNDLTVLLIFQHCTLKWFNFRDEMNPHRTQVFFRNLEILFLGQHFLYFNWSFLWCTS